MGTWMVVFVHIKNVKKLSHGVNKFKKQSWFFLAKSVKKVKKRFIATMWKFVLCIFTTFSPITCCYMHVFTEYSTHHQYNNELDTPWQVRSLYNCIKNNLFEENTHELTICLRTSDGWNNSHWNTQWSIGLYRIN